MIYRFRSGSRISGVDSQTAGERLEKIREDNGGKLMPQDVVEDAKQKHSPLHNAFEWDDGKAAIQHRLAQARCLVGAVVVVVDEAPDEPPVRAFVNIRQDGDEDNSYTSVRVAMADKVLRFQVIARAMAEAKAFQEKYRDLSELADIFEAIDNAASKLSEELTAA